jgi:hypothetical protein
MAEVAEGLPKHVQQRGRFSGAAGKNAYPCDLCGLRLRGQWRTEKNEGKTKGGKTRHSVSINPG